MKKLGISIYPGKSEKQADLDYIEKAGKLGYKKIFTCLLSFRAPAEVIIDRLSAICKKAKEYGMEVFADVNDHIFELVSDDLAFYADMGLKGIRLDTGFSPKEIVDLSHNQHGLLIELNASMNDSSLDLLAFMQINFDQLSMCHNFYPMTYSGLPIAFLNEANHEIKKYRLPIAAFVTSQNPVSLGPWDEANIFCTLEEHRNKSMASQFKHYSQISEIDEVLIANYPATDEELERMAKLNKGHLKLRLDLEYELSDNEKEVLYNHDHFVRPDISDYMFRSTMTRIVYKDKNLDPKNTRDLKRGDVCILNNKAGRYMNEVHIAKADMVNDGSKNVIGRVRDEELVLLNYLKAMQRFDFE